MTCHKASVLLCWIYTAVNLTTKSTKLLISPRELSINRWCPSQSDKAKLHLRKEAPTDKKKSYIFLAWESAKLKQYPKLEKNIFKKNHVFENYFLMSLCLSFLFSKVSSCFSWSLIWTQDSCLCMLKSRASVCVGTEHIYSRFVHELELHVHGTNNINYLNLISFMPKQCV